ncbi:hypothetical protein FB451DRAFT_1403985 [Mycena latifolia]|nr:hypothetical protein FB451DRAFT_1403985 [Mycena latifolia]
MSSPQTQKQYAPTPPPPKHRHSPYERPHSRVSPPPPSSSTADHDPYEMPRYGAGMYIYGAPPGYTPLPPPHAHYAYGRGCGRARARRAVRAAADGARGRLRVPAAGDGAAWGDGGPVSPGAGAGGINSVPVVHTDDAATKLSDHVRRRCFNCYTTETSTWRRSKHSPGKVLRNKCGLFEGTHARPAQARPARELCVAVEPNYHQPCGAAPQPHIAPRAHPHPASAQQNGGAPHAAQDSSARASHPGALHPGANTQPHGDGAAGGDEQRRSPSPSPRRAERADSEAHPDPRGEARRDA